MKMIFQDPISSLNPRRKVEDIIAEGLRIWKIGSDEDQAKKVDDAMLAVGLDPNLQRGRRPFQFSGGQCQRISIARAVVTDPKLIICDEPVSALDVSVQAQILNLLEDMKARYGLTLIFIAHDLAVVKNVSDRIVVMYLGKICEVGAPDALYKQPSHPYTAGLLASIPVPDPSVKPEERPALAGEIPSPVAPPSGCRFRTRCPVPKTCARSRSPRSRRSRPASSSRAISRSRRARRSRRATVRCRRVRNPRRLQPRGRPSIRCARMFLFTCVVPPAMVSARL